jgi:purine-binding chemotaxis protein CheW
MQPEEASNKGGGERTQVCSVRVGEGLFGIPIGHILEIVGGARPQPVPRRSLWAGCCSIAATFLPP